MRLTLRELTKSTLRRVPLAQEAFWSANYWLSQSGPFGRRWRLLGKWLEELDRCVGRDFTAEPRRILFFSVYPWWTDFNLPMAVVLAGRGCAVDFAWLPYFVGGREESRMVNHYRRWSKQIPVPSHPRLRMVNLLDVPESEATPEMRQAAHRTSTYDACWLALQEKIDVERDPLGRSLYDFRLKRNLDCMKQLLTLLNRERYDSMLTPVGGILEFAAAYALAEMRGLPCVTFEMHEFKRHLVISQTTPCLDWDTTDVWKADEPHTLTPERDDWAMAMLMRRENPTSWKNDYVWRGQVAAVQPGEELRRELRLDPSKPVALLCTNLAWDASVIGRTRVFPSMTEWIVATVAWFARHPEWQLVVRCHPAEAVYPSNEPIPPLIASRFPNLPANVCVVPPERPVNTYGLMRIATFGLSYVSTVGLEMAARGVPVIVAGKVHYAEKGFTIDPKTPEEYFASLERMVSQGVTARLEPRQVELARCYVNVYFQKFPKPFPWEMLTHDLGGWTMSRLLSEEGDKAFGKTFDLLAGRNLS